MTHPGPDLDAPADPEHDPRATYAVDPRLVRRLATRVRASAGSSQPTYAPFTGQPIASLPLSTPDDVAAGGRCRPPGAAVLGPGPARPAARDPAQLPRPGARPAGRDPRPDPVGVGQGSQARVRGGRPRRDDRPLLRAHGVRAPRHAAAARHLPGLHPGRRQPGPQGRRRDHLALELPVHDGDLRRAAGPARRQHGRAQARLADAAVRAARSGPARRGRRARGRSGRSSTAKDR